MSTRIPFEQSLVVINHQMIYAKCVFGALGGLMLGHIVEVEVTARRMVDKCFLS